MTFSLPTVLVVSAAASTLTVIFYLLLYKTRRRENTGRFCLWAALANASYGFRLVCQLVAPSARLAAVVAGDLLYLGWVISIWSGAAAFTGTERRSPSFRLVPPLLAAWIVFARCTEVPFPWAAIPQHLVGTVCFVSAGWLLWRMGRDRTNRGYYALAALHWMQGASTASYPFTRTTWWAPYGFTIYVVLSAGIGMGMIVALLLEEERGLIEEMEARRKAEEGQRRLNRELRALSDCNQTLMRAVDEPTLLEEICTIICDGAGYRMAWVGYPEDDEKQSIRPAAWAGVVEGYLDEAGISWGDSDDGRSPAGTAIRCGRTASCGDIGNSGMSRWCEKALKRGYRSCIALPLKDESETTFGVVVIYATETGAFDPEEVRLLEELAGDLAFGICVLRARTERARAERSLALLNFALDNVHEAAFLTDERGRFRYVNQESCRMTGYRRKELLRMGATDLVTDLSPESWAELWERLKSRSSLTFEKRHRNKGGELTPVEVNANYFEYNDRSYTLALVRDITERKRADEAVTKLSTAIDQSPVSILITDSQGRIEFVNPRFVQATGYSPEEVCGSNPRILKSGRVAPEVYRTLWETIRAGKVWQGELVNRRKDGSLITEYVTVSPIRNHDGEITHFIGLKEDITQRKTLEAQLFQAQKMEAVGQLAGGIAHDFNNILTAIIGYGTMLSMRMEQDEVTAMGVSQILAAAERAAELTKSLLAFSRKQTINPQPHDLNQIIRETQKFLQRIIGEDVELATRLSTAPLPVNVDRGQVEQMLMNLCTNARDAMSTGGTLTIETAVGTAEELGPRAAGGTTGTFARISIADTGTGMDEQVVKRIFEPFFTTKATGKGTGLGLSIVYGVIQQHNGFIEVESELGSGTTFTVYLPVTELPLEASGAGTERSAPRGGRETLLVADDDAQVRELVQKVFHQFGYRVLTAADGEEALEAFRLHREEIALVILDVIMPRLNGKEAADAINRLRPGSKTIFMSGYTNEIIHQRGIMDQGLQYVQKPLNPVKLLTKVREMLDGATAP